MHAKPGTKAIISVIYSTPPMRNATFSKDRSPNSPVFWKKCVSLGRGCKIEEKLVFRHRFGVHFATPPARNNIFSKDFFGAGWGWGAPDPPLHACIKHTACEASSCVHLIAMTWPENSKPPYCRNSGSRVGRERVFFVIFGRGVRLAVERAFHSSETSGEQYVVDT